jgi:hypothetical protein
MALKLSDLALAVSGQQALAVVDRSVEASIHSYRRL